MGPKKKRDANKEIALSAPSQIAAKDALLNNRTKDVTRINVAPAAVEKDCCQRLRAQVADLLYLGIPFVAENHIGWTAFADEWVNDDDKTLKTATMIDDIGGATLVPVITPASYKGDPIATMPLNEFINKGWSKQSDKWYLHQWQFTDDAAVRAKLCGAGQHTPLDVLGEDILRHYHGSGDDQGMQQGKQVVHGAHDTDYQYLFMGASQVRSRLRLRLHLRVRLFPGFCPCSCLPRAPFVSLTVSTTRPTRRSQRCTRTPAG